MIHHGNCIDVMRRLIDEGVKVHACVTSPPYWGLRDYGVEGQLGLEATPEQYVANMVEVFSLVWELLKDDGTLWLNLGDSYCAGATGSTNQSSSTLGGGKSTQIEASKRPAKLAAGLKPKDLVGIPWRVAFALQAEGWYLRSDIIWSKPNPMPESVTDRPTKAHEYIFLLSKKEKYYYNHEAIKEDAVTNEGRPAGIVRDRLYDYDSKEKILRPNSKRGTDKQRGHSRRHAGFNERWDSMSKEEQGQNGRNKRSVWTVAPQNYPDAHFATYPPKLIEPCILAGSRPGDIILDPFSGSGATGAVALEHGREYIGIELNADYIDLAHKRIANVQPNMLTTLAVI